RKRWPESNGIPGRNQLEWVAGMKWNHRPESPGISGRIALEYSAINLLCYMAHHLTGDFIPSVHDEFTWAAFEELRGYDFAPADVPVVEKIIEDYCSSTLGGN
ncbi:hypothetical protein JWH17_23060, partial [Desulfobulbus marinus]|nr:hypothetical protein [Desulfogranum marinum]